MEPKSRHMRPGCGLPYAWDTSSYCGSLRWKRSSLGMCSPGRVQDKWHHQWTGADAASVLIRGSKIDQLNLGCIRTMHRVGGIFCPVGAMKLWSKICSMDPRMEELGVSRLHTQRWLRSCTARMQRVTMLPSRVHMAASFAPTQSASRWSCSQSCGPLPSV